MNNDERILTLKKKIDEKKKNIGSTKMVPHTNLVCEWRAEKKNLNVLDMNGLLLLLWEFSSFDKFCKDFGLPTPQISGYDISDWIVDIRHKIENITARKEEDELKSMEAKLNKLLSDDKKTELELDGIETLLK